MVKRYFKTATLLLLLLSTSLISVCQSNLGGADSLLDFIKQNKNRSSLFLVKDNFLAGKLNEDKLMPLAGTEKILVAVEFAKQAGNKIFNEDAYMPLSELEKYYIPNTDNDAHPTWLKYERQHGHIRNDSIKMIDVARGMIMFNSNANTEFLMDTLGFDNVKSNLPIFGLSKHTALYPVVSVLFMYQNPKASKESEIIKYIRKFNEEQYAKFAFFIHTQLKYDPNFKKKFRPQDLTANMQRLINDKLPLSTTKEYVQIVKILNDRKYFGDNVYGVLAEVLETVMEDPANQKWLFHAGMKDGSTVSSFTNALYAHSKDGTKIEMAYFFKDLTGPETLRLQGWANDFVLKVMKDPEFRNKIKF